VSWNPFYTTGNLNGGALPWTPTVSGNDLIFLYSQTSGIPMAATMATFAAYIDTLTTPQSQFAQTFFVPTVGQTITAPVNGNSQWLILMPAGTITGITLLLPTAGVAIDGQEIIITTTQQITSLNMSTTGTTAINGTPTGAFTDSSPIKYKYCGALNIWFKVG
jgi:hypothetical protein